MEVNAFMKKRRVPVMQEKKHWTWFLHYCSSSDARGKTLSIVSSQSLSRKKEQWLGQTRFVKGLLSNHYQDPWLGWSSIKGTRVWSQFQAKRPPKPKNPKMEIEKPDDARNAKKTLSPQKKAFEEKRRGFPLLFNMKNPPGSVSFLYRLSFVGLLVFTSAAVRAMRFLTQCLCFWGRHTLASSGTGFTVEMVSGGGRVVCVGVGHPLLPMYPAKATWSTCG